MTLATETFNPRALERALKAVGGDQLYNMVIVAYQALDQFEASGFNEGHLTGFNEGHSSGFMAGYEQGTVDAVQNASVINASDESDIFTAALALDASIAKDIPTGEVLPDEDYCDTCGGPCEFADR